MAKVPTSIDEALLQMQTETRARGLLHLQSIFGSLFSKEALISALEMHSLNTEQASLYLQDHLHLQSEPKVLLEIQEENIELAMDQQVKSEFVPNFIPGPTTGKIALEFSLSPQYIDASVPVVYVLDEILKEIFSFLNAWERAKIGIVCKTWKMIDENTGYLYRRDCLKYWKKTARPEENVFFYPFKDTLELWGEEYPNGYNDTREYLKGLKTWRNMWLTRPKVRFNGVYIARIAFIKQGQLNIDNLPSFQRIVFFRYIRFYDDFSVCSINTPIKPREFLKSVDKQHPEARIGEWARSSKHLTMHLLAKNEIFTYHFDLKSSAPSHHDILKLIKVETRSSSNLTYSALNINNSACPKYFKFLPIKP